MTALVTGTLYQADGCVRLHTTEPDEDYTLVWTPDTTAAIAGDTLKIVSGIERQQPREITLHFGTPVYVGGGILNRLNPTLTPYNPPNCPEPYWVVGFDLGPLEEMAPPAATARPPD
jgi:hypothetical protein